MTGRRELWPRSRQTDSASHRRISFVALLGVVFIVGAGPGCSKPSHSPSPNSGVAGPVDSAVAADVAPTAVSSGPFGLRGGLTLQEIQKVIPGVHESERKGVYLTSTVPAPHPDFSDYILLVSGKYGLCAVDAVGNDIEAGSLGTELKSAFAEVEQALSLKYGKPKRYDFANGLMSDDQYWMIALASNDRTLASQWTQAAGSTLPGDIHALELQARATTTSSGFLKLRYEFKNVQNCGDDVKAAQNSVL